MGQRTDVAAAANARLQPIVEYGTDPRGHGLFAALTGAARATMTNARAVIDRGADFDGWASPPQVFRGLAPLALGGALPYTDANSQLADERSAVIDDPSLRIFAERLKRRNR